MIRQFLKKGKENAVSLEYLASVCNLNKRTVRDKISSINKSGEDVICTEGIGKGYFIASNIEEAKAYRAYNHSYFNSELEKERGIDRCIKTKFMSDDLTNNQISLSQWGIG